MAKYILSILRTQPIVVFSWGFHNACALPNGLKFSVSGYLHQGLVEVAYNEGADLFEVHLDNGRVKQQMCIGDVLTQNLNRQGIKLPNILS